VLFRSLPRTPPWKKKSQAQEPQLTFVISQDFGGGTSLPSENLNTFEYFVYTLNHLVGSSYLFLMKDILEVLDDKLIDFISFMEDFKRDIILPVLNRPSLNPCISSSRTFIKTNFYRRRLEGEILFGFLRGLNLPLFSLDQFMGQNFNTINEAFYNSRNKFFIYSFIEVLSRFKDCINDFFSFCKYVIFLLKSRTNSFSYKNSVRCQKYFVQIYARFRQFSYLIRSYFLINLGVVQSIKFSGYRSTLWQRFLHGSETSLLWKYVTGQLKFISNVSFWCKNVLSFDENISFEVFSVCPNKDNVIANSDFDIQMWKWFELFTPKQVNI
jgi:hypothetical protein